jgi:type IV pilus assembly protein PilM
LPIQRRKIIGVDIGSSAVKVVYNAGPRNWKAGMALLPDGVMTSNQINSTKLLANTVKKAMMAGKMSKGKAALCLAGSDVIIRHTVLPRMNAEQLKQNVIDEISSYLAVDPAQYVIDYKVQDVLTEGSAIQYKIMIVAVPKNIIAPYIQALSQAGLKVISVDVAANSKEKLVNHLAENVGNFAVIDLGMNASIVDTYLNGRFFVSKTSSTSLNTATTALAKALDSDPLKALDLILAMDPDPACKQAISDYIDQVLYDVARVTDYFRSRNQLAQVDKVFICGGGAKIPGVLQIMQEKLNIPVEDLNTLLTAVFSKKVDSRLRLSSFASAAGVTLMEVE